MNINFPALSTTHATLLLFRTTPLVQLLLHIDTFWPLSPSSISHHTFQCSSRSISLINSVHITPFHILHQLPFATPGTLKQSTFSNCSLFSITLIHSTPITIPGAPHNFTLTYIHSQLSYFAYSTKLTHQSTQLLLRVSHYCCTICK